jgi:hypothetical protein
LASNLFNMMNHMQLPAPAPGGAQRDMGNIMDFPYAIYDALQRGGDFGATEQWAELAGFGGGRSPCPECAVYLT